MKTLLEAVRGAWQCRQGAGLYILWTLGLNAAKRVADSTVGAYALFPQPSYWARVYQFSWDLILSLLFAAISVAAFTRMLRELDKPLWKVRNGSEAFQRFFEIWFILQLATMASIRLSSQMLPLPDNVAVAIVINSFFLLMTLVLFSVPIGACVMFAGQHKWSELPKQIAPLFRQFIRTVVLVIVNLFAFGMLIQLVDLKIQFPKLFHFGWLMILMDIPFPVLDVIVFAGVIQLCKADQRLLEARGPDNPWDE